MPSPGGQPGWAPPGGEAGWAPPGRQPGWAPPGAPPGWAPAGAYPGGSPTQDGGPAWGPQQPPWGGPPQRRNGGLIALVVVGVLVLAGLGVGAYLLVNTTSSAAPAVPADFRTVTTPTLIYAVPPGWLDSANVLSLLGAPLEGRADAPGYTCADAPYFRGLAASTFVTGERPAGSVATALAREAGRAFYQSATGAAPDVEVSAPRPFDVAGAEGQLVEATARTPVDDGCLATTGTVLLLAVSTTGPEGARGTAVLLVNGDTAGGPPSAPPLPDRATLDAVLASARLPSI